LREEIEMIPKSLDEWTVPVITDLLTKGYTETEDFDFKEMLPDRRNDEDKERLTKSCCAFADSNGGFLVFGISDNKTLPVNDRLVGIPRNPGTEFLVNFGIYPQQKCFPGVHWIPRNPPIQLDNGNEIHIIYIPKSWNAPHAFLYSRRGCTGWGFVKRTNTGNQDMSYEEIRMAFLQYYEKRLKLQLLQAELQNTKKHAEELLISAPLNQVKIGLGEFSLTVIETVLADTYTILAGQQELLGHLGEIRNRCRVVNDMLRIFYRVATVGLVGNNAEPHPAIEMHNRNVEGECRPIIFACDRTLSLLEKVMKI